MVPRFAVPAVLLVITMLALPRAAPAQPYSRFAVGDSALAGVLATSRAEYEDAWNALLVTWMRAESSRSDSAARLGALARRLARAEPGVLGTRIAAEALALRGRWRPVERQRRVQAAVAESLAALARTARDFGLADSLLQSALAAHRALGEKRREAWVLGTLGVNALTARQNDRALEWYAQALAARRALGDPRLLGNTLGDLGQTSLQLRRFDDAYRYLQESRVVREGSGQQAALANTYDFLGLTLRQLGKPDSAAYWHERALGIATARGDSARVMQVLVNYGTLFIAQNQVDEAIAAYRRALGIATAAGDRGRIEHNLGELMRRSGRYTEAIAHFERASQRRQEGRDPGLAQSLNGLGRARVALDPEAARAPLERAIALADSGGDRVTRIAARNNLALALLRLDDLTGAERMARAALDSATSAGDSTGVHDASTTLGTAATRRADLATAESWRRRAVGAATRLDAETRAAGNLSLAQALQQLGRLDEAEALNQEALATAREQQLTRLEVTALGNLGDVAERREDWPAAFRWYGEALALNDSLRERQSGESEAVRLLANRRFVFEAVIHLLGRLDARFPDSGYAARGFEWAERSRARALLDLVAAAGGAEASSRTIGIAEAQRALPGDRAALLEYSVGDSSTSLWVIRRGSWRHLALPARPAIRARVQALRRALADPAADTERLAAAAHALHQMVLAPAEPLLRGVEHLVVSPDGPLALVPFEALLARPPAGGKPRKGAWLVERFTTSYTPSASALASAPSPRSGDAVVAVGNPEFGGAAPAELVPLPSIAAEITALASAASGRTVVTLTGAGATRARLLGMPQLPGAGIVHVATHGDVNEEEPAHSGLWLAPEDSGGPPTRLEVADIMALRLSADLVTLSACETGLGRVERGEGVIGLQRAFLAAGARSVVVSLWKVNDRSTAALMERFYGDLLARGRTRAEALAGAKRALLKSADASAPFHWAPFVLIGEAGALTPR